MRLRAFYSVPLMLRFGINGITLYPFIFFPYSKDEMKLRIENLRIIRHELVHVKQIREKGWFYFYISYLLYYFAGLLYMKCHWSAYLGIPAEYEAYHTPYTKLTFDEQRELGLV
jgi:hypothetical protein